MSTSNSALGAKLPRDVVAWTSLVSRSIAAWDNLTTHDLTPRKDFPANMLRGWHSLDEFLAGAASSLFFWFFQRRRAFMSQKHMKKWSRDELDDYILLPALNGFVTRSDCFFLSHFWRTRNHPDPGGEYLRLNQAELESQTWSYIWADWSCMPQAPRSLAETAYFQRCLRTMSGIIRNCGFMYFYPPFEPRLWILYEITECLLTSAGGIGITPDIEPYLRHIDEMIQTGVQTTLARHAYRCSYDPDRQYLTSWLELLVLLHQLGFDVDTIRMMMDHMTWHYTCEIQYYPGVVLSRYQGTLIVKGTTHTFTPFPPWDDGKYSSNV